MKGSFDLGQKAGVGQTRRLVIANAQMCFMIDQPTRKLKKEHQKT